MLLTRASGLVVGLLKPAIALQMVCQPSSLTKGICIVKHHPGPAQSINFNPLYFGRKFFLGAHILSAYCLRMLSPQACRHLLSCPVMEHGPAFVSSISILLSKFLQEGKGQSSRCSNASPDACGATSQLSKVSHHMSRYMSRSLDSHAETGQHTSAPCASRLIRLGLQG